MEPKAPSSGIKPPQASRLALPGSMTKRARPGSVDLEDLEKGLDAKKLRMNPPDAKGVLSNLTKAKSKSTMNIADRSSIRGRSTMSTRPVPNRSSTASTRPTVDRRATTTSALNNRTNQENRFGREKSTVGGLRREKSSITRGGSTAAAAAGRGGKRPAWDLKGRLEDMEAKFKKTEQIMENLQVEKQTLEVDNEVKLEVVTKTSQEATQLRARLDDAEAEVVSLKKKIQTAEDEHSSELTRLRRQLENEEFNRSSLERKLKALEDELSCKQTEVCGLKNSVAELVSSRSGLEASLSSTQMALETATSKNEALAKETESQKLEMQRLMEKSMHMETERRKLHNLVQELKGNIRVFCRLRPLLGEEIAKYGSINHIKINSDSTLELVKSVADNDAIASGTNKNAKYDFEFDRVFDSTATQSNVFEEISQLVQSALDGYNVCVFAYGQTGSGKTYTMEGGDGSNLEQAGMIPKTISQIFDVTDKLKEKGWTYTLQASFLEIYNEEIRDLLATEKNLKYDIKMADSKGADVYVTNLKSETVTSEAQIFSLLKRARKHRAVAETLCNERSSRSHSVFMLKISGSNEKTTENCCGTLNLVDLAGSERVKDSGSEGQRLTEARSINSSLSNLGNVIMALAQKSSHIPYRNSKLTHLLQNCLGGNAKTLMFVNLNPREDTFNENLNSLRFATKVNQCHIGTATKKVK